MNKNRIPFSEKKKMGRPPGVTKSERISITMPAKLKKAVEAKAIEAECSVSEYICRLLYSSI